MIKINSIYIWTYFMDIESLQNNLYSTIMYKSKVNYTAGTLGLKFFTLVLS